MQKMRTACPSFPTHNYLMCWQVEQFLSTTCHTHSTSSPHFIYQVTGRMSCVPLSFNRDVGQLHSQVCFSYSPKNARTYEYKDVGMQECEDTGMQECRDVGMQGHGDVGMWGCKDMRMRGCKDLRTRGHKNSRT